MRSATRCAGPVAVEGREVPDREPHVPAELLADQLDRRERREYGHS
jgi:hypothetical protein